MEATLDLKNFEDVLRKIVREVMQEEMMKLRAMLLPHLSDEEQANIEELYGEPSAEVKRAIEIDV